MYFPSRKRDLTGREMAELQEADAARKRRKALCDTEIQAQNDAELEQHAAEEGVQTLHCIKQSMTVDSRSLM